jgi:hypothetical protein
MHPVIAQAIVAERTRDIRAHAADAGRARQLRRAGHARRFPAGATVAARTKGSLRSRQGDEHDAL